MLLKNENQIFRVLQTQGDKSLVIVCIKKTMPKWIDTAALSDFTECSEAALHDLTQYPDSRKLTQNEQRIAQEHFTMIAGVLPFIGNEQKRSQMIDFLADHQSKQTIRKYLCLYLVYQEVAALAPPPKGEKELTQNEKNMRWALNKFFYTKNKNSLMTAYTLMLKEKYCDQQGQLGAAYPTFDQFRYFYRKTKKMQQYYISRDGIKDYQRNNRPLLGDGVQQFAPAVGVGMLDSTICDICIVYYNSSRIVDFPFTEEMLADGVKPNASSIFAWGKKQMGANFISVTPQKLIQTLLPRTTGTFTRKGLRVHGLRYKHDDYTEAFLSGGEVTVAYNPEDVTEIWLLDNGQYVPFTLIESRFNGKSLVAVQTMQTARKQTINTAAADNLQAQINLAEHIQVIASQGRQTDVGIKNIRNTRKREQARTHIDFVKEGTNCG